MQVGKLYRLSLILPRATFLPFRHREGALWAQGGSMPSAALPTFCSWPGDFLKDQRGAV